MSTPNVPIGGISKRSDIVTYVFNKIKDHSGIPWRVAWKGPILRPGQYDAPAFYVFDIEERLKEQPPQNCMDPSLVYLTLLIEFWAVQGIDEFASDKLNELLIAIQRVIYDDPTFGKLVQNTTELGSRLKVVEDKGNWTVVGEVTYHSVYGKSVGPIPDAP